MLRVRAASVHPVTAPPIPDGAVLVDASGLIVAVGPNDSVPRGGDIPSLEFATGRLTPGLVNCHTHLELTGLAGLIPQGTTFPQWIRRIRELKDATSSAEFRRGVEAGLRQSWAAGVTCVAETGSTGTVLDALHQLGGRGIYYHEAFGPDPRQCRASLDGLRADIERLGSLADERVRLGVSPHAPYTVSAPLYRGVADFARAEGLPMAVHIAESPEEVEFVRDGTGPFAIAWGMREIEVAPHGCSPVAYLARLGVLDRTACLCIHCVQVTPDDIGQLKSAGASIAHCPRSNRAHAHGAAPLAAFRRAGIPVGLGTDSVVSTGDIALWPEAIAAGLSGEDALRMLTIEGARALGLEGRIGSLEVGKEADLAVFPTAAAPTALLTVVAGRVVRG